MIMHIITAHANPVKFEAMMGWAQEIVQMVADGDWVGKIGFGRSHHNESRRLDFC